MYKKITIFKFNIDGVLKKYNVNVINIIDASSLIVVSFRFKYWMLCTINYKYIYSNF